MPVASPSSLAPSPGIPTWLWMLGGLLALVLLLAWRRRRRVEHGRAGTLLVDPRHAEPAPAPRESVLAPPDWLIAATTQDPSRTVAKAPDMPAAAGAPASLVAPALPVEPVAAAPAPASTSPAPVTPPIEPAPADRIPEPPVPAAPKPVAITSSPCVTPPGAMRSLPMPSLKLTLRGPIPLTPPTPPVTLRFGTELRFGTDSITPQARPAPRVAPMPAAMPAAPAPAPDEPGDITVPTPAMDAVAETTGETEASIGAPAPAPMTPEAEAPATATGTPVTRRDAELADHIDAERRRLASLTGAARAAGFRELELRLRAPLAEASGYLPWLAWVHVLADGSRQLQGPAARQRLAEADAVFVRLQARPSVDIDEARAIDFARAYYLRLRAQHERGGVRRQSLAEAAQLLVALRGSDFPAAAGVALEQAELALAGTGSGDDRHDIALYQQAMAHATTAADIEQTRVPAFRALLSALLGWQRLAPEPARARQAALVARWLREADVPASAETLRLLAHAALLADEPVEATQWCVAAWQAGVDDRALLAGWQRADAQWARQSSAASDRQAWERQHRLLRLATSTT